MNFNYSQIERSYIDKIMLVSATVLICKLNLHLAIKRKTKTSSTLLTVIIASEDHV